MKHEKHSIFCSLVEIPAHRLLPLLSWWLFKVHRILAWASPLHFSSRKFSYMVANLQKPDHQPQRLSMFSFFLHTNFVDFEHDTKCLWVTSKSPNFVRKGHLLLGLYYLKIINQKKREHHNHRKPEKETFQWTCEVVATILP